MYRTGLESVWAYLMTNSTFKCAGCKERFKTDKRIKLPSGNFHSIDCASQCGYNRQKRAAGRAKAKADKEFRAETKRMQKALEDRPILYKRLQILVNQWVLSVRDKGEPCCTCGTIKQGIKYDAGHRRSVGSCKELRFNPLNIHKQCNQKCNVYGSGKRKEYDEFIVDRYGQEVLDRLDGTQPSLKKQYPLLDDIRAEIDRYRKLIRAAGLRPNT